VGNVFLPEKIDQAIKLGREFDIYKRMIDDLTMVPLTQFYIGVDAGFGSSKFAIVLVCNSDDKVFVLETVELDRQDFNYCINKISEVMSRYDLSYQNTRIFIDASSPAVVTAVKQSLDERPDYLEIVARRKKQKIKDPCYDRVVVPVNFSTTEKRNMLANVKQIVDEGLVTLDLEKHAGLVLALRTAQATDLILDKEATQSDDLLDAFGLACHNLVTYTNKQIE
jgi:hypothetical protein